MPDLLLDFVAFVDTTTTTATTKAEDSVDEIVVLSVFCSQVDDIMEDFLLSKVNMYSVYSKCEGTRVPDPTDDDEESAFAVSNLLVQRGLTQTAEASQITRN